MCYVEKKEYHNEVMGMEIYIFIWKWCGVLNIFWTIVDCQCKGVATNQKELERRSWRMAQINVPLK